jgi:hypothetical protein
MVGNTVTVLGKKSVARSSIWDNIYFCDNTWLIISAIIVCGVPDDLFHLSPVIQQEHDIGRYVVSSYREDTGVIGNNRIRHKNKAINNQANG